MAKKKIIVDPKGQWNHPGEMTMIPSGNITMAGVPYSVLGIDNLGNHMMMMPGENYNFEGSSVLEIPVGYHKMPDGSIMSNKQQGGELSNLQDFFKRTLGFDKVFDHGENLGEFDAERVGDAVRHASTSAETVAHLNKWYNPFSYIPGANMVLANVLGVGHEVSAGDNTWKEHGYDLYNNLIGSYVGSLPNLTQKQRDDLILQLSKKGQLPYLKQHGGAAESTGVYVDPRTFKGSEFLLNKQKTKTSPKKTLSQKDKKQQLNELNRQLEEQDYAQYVTGIENPNVVNKYASLIDPTGFMDLNSIVEQGIRRGTFDPTDAAGVVGSLVPGSSGFKALKLFLNTAGKAGDVVDVVNEQYEQGGQNMKKPNNKGFNKLPKYVQKHIMENMKQEGGHASGDPVYMNTMDGYIMNMGGMPCYNCGGQYQMGGEYLPEHVFSYFMTGENLPIAQQGATVLPGQKRTQQQWAADNLALGYQPVPTAAGSTAPGAYQKFYNPKLYSPSTLNPINGQLVSFTNIANPNDVSGNPFIEYQPPRPQIKAPVKAYVERDPTHKPIEFGPNMNYNPNTGVYSGSTTGQNIAPIQETFGATPLKQFGGSNLNKFMTNYMKKLGGAAPQGQSLDEVIQQKNKDFVDYIANNTKAAMFRDEAMNFQKGFAQMGQQYNADKSLMEGQTDYISGLEDQFKGSAESQFMPDEEFSYLTPGIKRLDTNKQEDGLMKDPNLETTNQMFNQYQNLYNSIGNKQRPEISNSQKADLALAGMQGINSWFNAYQANKQDKFNRDKMTIENTAGTAYGSRGNYDVNQGNFRPNQMTPSFKKGGQYSMDHKTIQDLLAQGYELEFL